MSAVRLHGPHDLRVEQVPTPGLPGPGQALIRVTATGICGSDLHTYKDARIGEALVQQPLILGHEFGGVVGSRRSLRPRRPRRAPSTRHACSRGSGAALPSLPDVRTGASEPLSSIALLRQLPGWRQLVPMDHHARAQLLSRSQRFLR
ncbi:hypothetical protein C2W62_22035 [Candidatus Entotheonella serta]|nr:hypothetical protein C2W62_22035 [Candidatus Entotheonella serta]